MDDKTKKISKLDKSLNIFDKYETTYNIFFVTFFSCMAVTVIVLAIEYKSTGSPNIPTAICAIITVFTLIVWGIVHWIHTKGG